MRQPSWDSSPKIWLAAWIVVAVSCGGWLVVAYVRGTWTPSLFDAARAIAAGLACFLYYLSEDAQYRAMGDRYIRALLSRELGAQMTGRPSWLVVASLFLWAGAWMWTFGTDALRPFIVGYAVAVSALAWYPLRRAVYERMWELCRAESGETGEQQVGLRPTV